MKLSNVGEARIHGYLFVLGRSLRASLPRDVALDALGEIESHIRERVAQTESMPNEAAALERVLGELGAPLRVAQAYSAEFTVDEALTTGQPGAMARAFWQLATTTGWGFLSVLALFSGYTAGVGFLVIAVLKPIFPQNVGLFVRNGIPLGLGAEFPPPAGTEVWGGYWIIPIALSVGVVILVITHRSARRFLAWWRERKKGRGSLLSGPSGAGR
jgi:uncharacterized membrane protein